jgi:Sensors of blue-light using FAD
MLSLVYVSRPVLGVVDRIRELERIRDVSAARNAALDVTGLLITAAHYFAQLLEGPAENLEHLMASILADRRHSEVRIIRRREVAEPRLPGRPFTRYDTGAFGDRAVNRALAAAHAGQDPEAITRVDRLIDTIVRSELASE